MKFLITSKMPDVRGWQMSACRVVRASFIHLIRLFAAICFLGNAISVSTSESLDRPDYNRSQLGLSERELWLRLTAPLDTDHGW
jgi:hypothetical protein